MDQNDVLDWTECEDFVKAVMKDGYDAQSFKETYEKMDKNADGLISKAELIEKVVEIGKGKNLFGQQRAPSPPAEAQEESKPEETGTQETRVEESVFRNGLGCLGKTFNNARHAYLSLNISSKALDTINVSTDSAG